MTNIDQQVQNQIKETPPSGYLDVAEEVSWGRLCKIEIDYAKIDYLNKKKKVF